MLAITAWPDDRRSTENLGMIVAEINRRAGCSAHLWYLRTTDHQVPAEQTRVIDSLRTWPPCAALDRIGLGPLAAWVRGRRVRWWLRDVQPDVVILDDGLGEHVLSPLRRRPALVVRHNDVSPEDLHMEPPPRNEAQLFVVPPSAAEASTTRSDVYVEYPFADTDARTYSDPTRRDAARRANDLPMDVDLVVGWGDDGWLDGPDLFLRTIWALEHRHGRIVHGVWFGLVADPHEAERLRREADRLGIADRFHHRERDSMGGRLSGDAVLFPYRSTADAEDVRDAILSGTLVVAFRATDVDDPVIRRVRDLDVDEAAAAIHAGLDEDRMQRWESSRARVDVALLADRIVALGG